MTFLLRLPPTAFGEECFCTFLPQPLQPVEKTPIFANKTTMIKHLICAVLSVCTLLPLHAQTDVRWDNVLDPETFADDDNEFAAEAFGEQWEELAANPFNLNTATQEELETLPFLSDEQVMALLEYLYRYKSFNSWGELLLIPSIDRTTFLRLQQFTTLGSTNTAAPHTLKGLLRGARHTLVASVSIPFFKRRGDKNGYLGYPVKHNLRYTLAAGNRLKAAFVAAQDAGEPFFSNVNRSGYDYYSGFVQLRFPGLLRQLTIGRYRAVFGMGLVSGNRFSPALTAGLPAPGRPGSRITGHSSRLENSYLQGMAATLALGKHTEATLMASWRQVDATMNDSLHTITTLLSSGYHRTPGELRRKHNASQWTAGGHIGTRWQRFRAGITALGTGFNRPLLPDTTQPFRRFYPAGRQFFYLSADYAYLSRAFSVQGETATNGGKALATVNTLRMSPGHDVWFTLLQRYYSYRYATLLGNGFSQGGHTQNESGLYIGASWKPERTITLAGFLDAAYFPWYKYLVNGSSTGLAAQASISYENENWQAELQYRFRQKQQNNEDKTALDRLNRHRVALSGGYRSTVFSSLWQAQLTRFNSPRTHSTGKLIAGWNEVKGMRWLVGLQMVYFHTTDYNSRLYLYERGLLYTFAFPMFYGHGIHGALVGRYRWGASVQTLVKVSSTQQFDRHSSGSGYRKVEGRNRTTAEIQLVWHF